MMLISIVPWILFMYASPPHPEPPIVKDDAGQQILESFLGHVQSSESYCTPEAMAKFAEQPEDIVWQASKYIRMPLVAYRLTGDTNYLDMFVKRMDTLCDCLEEGADGFLGWYGLPLELFRHPEHPQQQVDVILTSFVMAGLMAEFARVIQGDEMLNAQYDEAAQRYLTLAEEHLVKKWDVRGRYKDLGETGAVYITHPDLKPTKANLTQPHNKHAKIIRALLNLYAATQKDKYLIKAIKLGTRFKQCLTLVEEHYKWHYWEPAGAWDRDTEDPSKWEHWIGAEHRGGYYSLSLSQAVLLYEHGLVFNKTDIERFIKTQTTVCWNGDVNNPRWSRIDGQASDQSYLCTWLAPFDERIYELAYGTQAQRERLKHKEHVWRGGVIAGDWLEFKYLIYPRWKGGAPAEKAVVSQAKLMRK
ncbi:hypothetical protein H8E77_12665 [bacterium]|nr:hypothetical protein [bacterium]